MEGGATLIADDQTLLSVHDGCLNALAPPSIAGLIEARHVGFYKVPFLAEAPVALYVELVQSGEPLERLPPSFFATLLGLSGSVVAACRVRGVNASQNTSCFGGSSG